MAAALLDRARGHRRPRGDRQELVRDGRRGDRRAARRRARRAARSPRSARSPSSPRPRTRRSDDRRSRSRCAARRPRHRARPGAGRRRLRARAPQGRARRAGDALLARTAAASPSSRRRRRAAAGSCRSSRHVRRRTTSRSTGAACARAAGGGRANDRRSTLDDVRKAYPGGVEALRGVSLRVERAASCSAVVGPSGSGKSTLLHIMGTLDRPTSGARRGRRPRRRRRSPTATLAGLRARHIGFVFQQFFLLDGMTALENVATGLLYTGWPRPSGGGARARCSSASASATGSTTGRRSCRAASASAWRSPARCVGRPAIVFADEPTGNLDTRAGARDRGAAARAPRRGRDDRGDHARPRDRGRAAAARRAARRRGWSADA